MQKVWDWEQSLVGSLCFLTASLLHLFVRPALIRQRTFSFGQTHIYFPFHFIRSHSSFKTEDSICIYSPPSSPWDILNFTSVLESIWPTSTNTFPAPWSNQTNSTSSTINKLIGNPLMQTGKNFRRTLSSACLLAEPCCCQTE